MNSKEALRTIKYTNTNIIKYSKIGMPLQLYSVRELRKTEIKTIQKDLEILEILKNHIKIQKYYDSFETGDDRQWLEIDLDNSDIQFKKVKEWLDNE